MRTGPPLTTPWLPGRAPAVPWPPRPFVGCAAVTDAAAPGSVPPPTPPASVLVPLDGSAYADRAVPVGRALAEARGGELRLLAVAEGDEATARRDHLGALAAQGSAPATVDVRAGSPAEEITAAAAAEGQWVVCLASHGR